jgi:hypothetical protein
MSMSMNKHDDTIDWSRPIEVGPGTILPRRSAVDPFDPDHERCDLPGCPTRAAFFCQDCSGIFCPRCLTFHACAAQPEKE